MKYIKFVFAFLVVFALSFVLYGCSTGGCDVNSVGTSLNPVVPPNTITGTVRGFIQNSNNEPISGATVTLNAVRSVSAKTLKEITPIATTTTDITGYYEFKNIAPGNYVITAMLNGQTLGTQLITVNPDGTSPEVIIIAIQTKGSVTGGVKKADGSPLEGAQVSLFKIIPGADAILVGTTASEADGTFSFTDLEANAYSIRAEYNGLGEVFADFVISAENLNQTVSLVFNSATSLGSISGYVTAAGGSALENANVILTSGTTTLSAVTDAKGYYLFGNLQPGEYSIKASALGYNESNPLVLTVKEKTNVSQDIVLEPQPSTLSGIVTDTADVPFAEATITLTNTADNSSQTVSTAADGSYNFNTSAGSYKIIAAAVGYTSSAEIALTLAPGQTQTQNFVLTSQAHSAEAGEISGTVNDQFGGPVPGATVFIAKIPVDPDIIPIPISVYTDRAGNYVSPVLEAGDYQVNAYKYGYGDSTIATVTITTNDTGHPGTNLTLSTTEIRGVVSFEGALAKGVTVNLMDEYGDTVLQTTQSDENGAYSFSGVDTYTTYLLHATNGSVGETRPNVAVNLEGNNFKVQNLSLVTDMPTGEITVNFVDANNNPYVSPGAMITVQPKTADAAYKSKTTKGPSVIFSNMPDGVYQVEIDGQELFNVPQPLTPQNRSVSVTITMPLD